MMAKFAPTLVALLILTANHTLMHGGHSPWFAASQQAGGDVTMTSTTASPPEYNVTGIDYATGVIAPRGPLIDNTHRVMVTRPGDPRWARIVDGPGASTEQASMMLDVASEFGIQQIATMCPPQDIEPCARLWRAARLQRHDQQKTGRRIRRRCVSHA